MPAAVARTSATTASAAATAAPTRATTITMTAKRVAATASSGKPARARPAATATTAAMPTPYQNRRDWDRTKVRRTRRALADLVADGSSQAISAACAVRVCGPAV